MNKPVRFSLIRHANTLWNQEKRIQGHADSPLSPRGEAEARTWALAVEGLAFNRLLSSDLGRARQTAAILNARRNLPVTFDARLREQDFGRWTGKRFADLPRRDLETQTARGWEFRPPGGENRLEVAGRAREALLAAALQWPGDEILAVCHEGVLKALFYCLSRREYLPHEPALLLPGRLHRITVEGGALSAWDINLPLGPVATDKALGGAA